MSRALGHQVKEVFLAAREVDAGARGAYLDAACAGDASVRRRVEALLRAETALGPDLLSPAPSVEPAPDEIDRYDLLDVLGEGGFGTVYRARRRGGVETEVALKVLRAGLDSGEALARFRVEQKALEAMDHPGIARVLDAGLTRTGRPYLVMELVRGEAITAFCDRERLSIRERVSLMADVCRAVQHAHHKGVIHRDLKPSNILAWRSEGDGGRVWAKVIDFGVAKALRDARNESASATAITLGARTIGTPAYMSPEQARGESDVDTRADVYALGAVLYELLCGSPVIDAGALAAASPGEIERLVCQVDPPAPSDRLMEGSSRGERALRLGVDATRARRALRRELDWITQRALEKDRARRYPTAEALAADLERAAAGEPVDAAPPSRWYRARRMALRHRAAFVAALAAAAALVVGAGVALREARQAQVAERAAERDRRIAEAISGFLRQDLLGSLKPEAALSGPGGRDVMMRDVMDKAAQRLERASAPGGSLADEPTVRASLNATFANTYLALGRVQSAETHARAALAAAELAGDATGRTVIRTTITLARALMWNDKMTEAIDRLEGVVERARRELGSADADTIEAELFLGVSLTNSGRDVRRARDLFAACHEALIRQRGADDPQSLFAGYLRAHAILKLGDIDAGEALQRDICERRERVLGPRHPDTLWSRLELARANVHRGGKYLVAAVPILEGVVRDRTEVLGPDHIDTLDAAEELGDQHLQARRLKQAEAIVRPLYETWKRLGGDDHAKTIRAESVLGETLARQGDFEHGMPLMTDALERMERLFGDGHYDASWIRWRVRVATEAQEQGSWYGIE